MSLLLIVMAAVATSAAPDAQASDQSSATLLDRAGRYVNEYEAAFAAIVSEERQVQKIVRADGRIKQTRTLRSDFLLIKAGPEWAQAFRDIIEVDGKTVRERAERLQKLFLESPETALERATAIARESQRHNIGVNRQGNSPLLPLMFLHSKNQARSRFLTSGGRIQFEELQRPSLLGTRRGRTRFDMPARGVLIIDPASGRVLSADLTAIGPPPSYSTSLSVRYAEDTRLRLSVPVSVHERYWFEHDSTEDRLEVEATYSNFRRFEVSTNEHIKTPKQVDGALTRH